MKKANGQGSIYYEKDRNKYRATLTDPNGRRISARHPSKEEAEAWLITTRANMIKGLYVSPSEYTVLSWAAEYLEVYATDIAPRTHAMYTAQADKLAPIGNIKLTKLTPAIIQKFYNQFEGSDDARFKVHAFLRLILKQAFRLKLIPENPLDAIKAPKREQEEIQTFTKEEITQILTYLKTSQHYKRYYPLIYAGVVTGARLGELLALKHKSVHHGYIIIDCAIKQIGSTLFEGPPKTKSSVRKITIGADLERVLRGSSKVVGYTEYLLHTKYGGPIHITIFERAWRKILINAGVPHKNFHALRHTHATELLAAGVPLIEVSRRLGHKSPTVTLNKYGHAVKGYDEQIPEMVDKVFNL